MSTPIVPNIPTAPDITLQTPARTRSKRARPLLLLLLLLALCATGTMLYFRRRPPLITPQPSLTTFPTKVLPAKTASAFTVHAHNVNPFDDRGDDDGTSYYDMYVTPLLTVVEDRGPFGKMLVEPHWVGLVEVWAEGPNQEVTWQVEPQAPAHLAPLPGRLSDLLLVRPGLPPTPLKTKPDDKTIPLWWDEWEKRAAGSSVAAGLASGHLVVSRDFGTNLPKDGDSTTIRAKTADGTERRIVIGWKQLPDIHFTFQLNLVEMTDKAGKPIPDNSFPVEVGAVRERLARIPWIQSVKGLPDTDGKAPLPLNIDVISSQRLTSAYFARQMGDKMNDVVEAAMQGRSAPRLR